MKWNDRKKTVQEAIHFDRKLIDWKVKAQANRHKANFQCAMHPPLAFVHSSWARAQDERIQLLFVHRQFSVIISVCAQLFNVVYDFCSFFFVCLGPLCLLPYQAAIIVWRVYFLRRKCYALVIDLFRLSKVIFPSHTHALNQFPVVLQQPIDFVIWYIEI